MLLQLIAVISGTRYDSFNETPLYSWMLPLLFVPSSSEVTSSCHAFLGSFVLKLWTLLLKLSMALWARDAVDPVAVPAEDEFDWASLAAIGGAVGLRGFKCPLLWMLEPMLEVSGDANLGTDLPLDETMMAFLLFPDSKVRGRVFLDWAALGKVLTLAAASGESPRLCGLAWNSVRPLYRNFEPKLSKNLLEVGFGLWSLKRIKF